GGAAQAQADLPHLQRLHERTAERPRLGLLPPRSLLRRAPRRGPPEARQGGPEGMTETAGGDGRRPQLLAVLTAFLALFAIVGFALYGLPFFYDFFVQDLGWTRQQVTSGNAYSKIVAALLFGALAGILVDRLGPRHVMIGGILVAGGALVGLG